MGLEYGILFLIIGAMGAFFMAFNNGANDVANAFASAVGSKALKMKLAVAIASVVTFTGALLLGGQVAAQLVASLVPPNIFQDPNQYVIAMISVLISSGIFVLISTITALPVSSSQAIVGSLTGISILLVGWQSVQWLKLGVIVSGWIISPLIAGVLALVMSLLIERLLIGDGTHGSVLLRMRRWLPVIVSAILCIGIYSLFTVTNLKQSIGIDSTDTFVQNLTPTQRISRQMAQVDGMRYDVFHLDCIASDMHKDLEKGIKKIDYAAAKNKRTPRQGGVIRNITEKQSQVNELTKTIRSKMGRLVFLTTGRQPALFYASRLEVLICAAVLFIPVCLLFRRLIKLWLKKADDSPEGAQKAFKRLQIGTSCYVAFAIGSNDVANSIAPILAIYVVVKAGGIPETFSAEMPLWILILGGLGMATGISVLGYRVMKTLGEGLTKINNARGFCIDFSVATSVVGASAFGLPVSTTHAATGAVVGSGLSQGRGSVRFSTLGKIAVGWIVTIPVSATITCVVFSLLNTCLP